MLSFVGFFREGRFLRRPSFLSLARILARRQLIALDLSSTFSRLLLFHLR